MHIHTLDPSDHSISAQNNSYNFIKVLFNILSSIHTAVMLKLSF